MSISYQSATGCIVLESIEHGVDYCCIYDLTSCRPQRLIVLSPALVDSDRVLGLHLLRGAAMTLLGAGLIGALAFDLRWSGPEQSAASMIWGFAPLVAATVLVDSHRRVAGWKMVGFGALMGLTLVLWVVVL